jgi:hypothetical protein
MPKIQIIFLIRHSFDSSNHTHSRTGHLLIQAKRVKRVCVFCTNLKVSDNVVGRLSVEISDLGDFYFSLSQARAW